MAERKTPDEETIQRNRDEEMSNMVFRVKQIRFYPEDLAKAETMEHDEKIAFFQWLRRENRYVELEDEPETT